MQIDEFVNARSMSTPAGCGGIVIVITNTLSFNFGFVAIWTALSFSALCGLLVLYTKNITFLEKLVHYVLNTLLIFSFATGANQGLRVAISTHENPMIAYAAENPALSDSFIVSFEINKAAEEVQLIKDSMATNQNYEYTIRNINDLSQRLANIEKFIEAKNPESNIQTGSRVKKEFFSDWLN